VQKLQPMSSVGDPESDLTRKQRREQARQQRREAEEAAAAQSSQRKRLIQLGAAAVVLVAIVAIVAIASGGGSKSAPAPKTAAANAAQAEVVQLLQGIPQSANVLGNPSAPVKLVYYGDLECPFCKQFTLTSLPSIIAHDVRTGKAKIEYRSMQTATREREIFQTQQVAAMAAGKQNRAWYYIELFYHEQGEEDSGYVTESYLQGLAAQVPGLKLSQWSEDRNNPAYANQVISDAQSANQNGFSGTPSFIVEKAGAAPQKLDKTSLTDPKEIEAAIEKQAKA
jgi:protein-disulfide isomerase